MRKTTGSGREGESVGLFVSPSIEGLCVVGADEGVIDTGFLLGRHEGTALGKAVVGHWVGLVVGHSVAADG